VDHFSRERRSMSCAERFLVENNGDLAIHLLQAVQLGDAMPEPILIGMLCVALHTALQPMLACRAGLPDDLDPDGGRAAASDPARPP
jgi:hypothetical protein